MVNEGDALVTFSPLYPNYLDHVEMSSGQMRTVPLTIKEGTWRFDPQDLRRALQGNAKMLIVNSPHNPTGKVFSKEELLQITEIVKDFPEVVVISDEVYEFLCFDKRKHVHFATLEDNWKRTISIFSGGKLLNATGWKVGWAVGPQSLLHMGGVIANTVYYCFNSPGQVAFANSLDQMNQLGESGTSYMEDLVALFESNRNYLMKELVSIKNLPWEPLSCEGGYFVMVDITKCMDQVPEKYKTSHDYEEGVNKYRLNMPDGSVPRDLAFCRWLAVEKGLVLMPNSFFYPVDSTTLCDTYVRLAICKDRGSIEACVDRLKERML
jgi:aspartate/methionine/tyrosine aminotransferase